MNLIAPIILILASVGVFFGYINPTYTADTGATDNESKSVKELQVVQQEYENSIQQVAKIEEVRNGLLTKLSTFKVEDKDKLGKLLPDHIDSVRLLIDINNIAQAHGMSLANIKLEAPGDTKNNSLPVGGPGPTGGGTGDAGGAGLSGIGPDNQKFASTKLNFSVSGSYEDFLGFLHDLEHSLRVVDIVSLSLKSGGSAQSSSAPGSSKPAVIDPNASATNTYTFAVRTYNLK